jgi:putative polymerase
MHANTSKPWIPTAIVFGCCAFNFVLCFINTRVFGVNEMMVIASELLLISAALAYGVFHPDKRKLYWFVVFFLQIVIVLILSMAREQILAKPLRDVMTMPIFIMLGLSAARAEYTKHLLWFLGFVVLIALFESFALDAFSQFFNFKEFYIAKGGHMNFENSGDSTLSVSGERPNGRFLFNVSWLHRISSIFLEPLSHGYFAAIAGIYFVAIKDKIRPTLYYSAIIAAFFLLWLSDSRTGIATLGLLMIARPLFARLPHQTSIFIALAAIILASLLYLSGMTQRGDEGIISRIHLGMSLMNNMDIPHLLGIQNFRNTADSGMADLIQNHSVFGFLLFWLAPLLYGSRLSQEGRVYIFGVAIFMTFGFLFSFAIFTIKIAGILWFQYGYIIAKYGKGDEEPSQALTVKT